MNRHWIAILRVAIVSVVIFFANWTNHAYALPAPAMVNTLSNSVLRVEVNLANGKHGLGSAVVVAKNEVVTNCHVVRHAVSVSIMVDNVPHTVSAIKPDWYHDLCLLEVEALDLPAVHMGASQDLHYEEAVFTVAYPDSVTAPVITYGVVKELIPMDGSVVIRATSPFKLGASGGGVFNEAGDLVGIITLKSRGDEAYYYYMPMEWVKALMQRPELPAQALVLEGEKPFWAASQAHQPYFMRVVHPSQAHDWQALLSIAHQWVSAEPHTAESWFYLALAEYALGDYNNALAHFQEVLAIHHSHTEALAYLEKVVEKTSLHALTAKHHEAVALLQP